MNNVNNKITSSDANKFFGSNSYALDSVTLESVLRYIALKHHDGNLDTLEAIKVRTGAFSNGDRGNAYAETDGYELYISAARAGAALPIIDKEGWVELNSPPYPVSHFLGACSETRVYVNEQGKRSVIFVRSTTEKWIDCLCSALFRVLPWYYPDGVVPEDEMKLFRAINAKNSDEFNAIINEACEGYDFKANMLKRSLIGWSSGYRKTQMNKLVEQLENDRRALEDYERRISGVLDSMANTNLMISSLEVQSEDSKTEVYDFFVSHPQIGLHQVTKNTSGNSLSYYVLEAIEYYDQDAFLRLYQNRNSPVGSAKAEIKEILYAIFAQNKGSIRAEAVFNMKGLSSINIQRYAISGLFSATHLPHPHLYEYGCLGGNGDRIREALAVGNWDVAIEQSIAAVKNINWGDHAVVSWFVRRLTNDLSEDYRYVVADNGKEMSLREFLNYIRETNNEGTTNG